VIADDPVDPISRECAVVMRLAADPQRLGTASMQFLFRSGATLTRAIDLCERRAAGMGAPADLPKLTMARQRIMTEIRRRT